MKKIKYSFLLAVITVFSSGAYAGSADRNISIVGCDNGEGDRVCWVNLIGGPIPGAPSACGSAQQVRWSIQSSTGADSTGEELYAMALMAAASGAKLRIAVDDFVCFSGAYPKVNWMSYIPN